VILQLDIAQESRLLSDPELRLRRGLKMRVLGLASLEWTIARQRARVAAVRDGDAATQFFRISATLRRRHNHIARLRNGDSVVEAQEEKEELATALFLEVLGSASPRTHDLSLANLGLAPLALDGLDATFSEDGVWGAVKSMPANKSPGPDGYSWEFYRACWPVVKGDILAALRAVFVGADQHFGKLNAAFLTLLPKKEGAINLKDFRPISLVHSFAKLVAKILALWLAPRMQELVDSNQTAFIMGRCIQDNFVLVQQLAKSLHHRRVPSLLLKLDIARAFDSVAWPFLLSILRQRGFGPRWIRWIAMLLQSASTAVLVNGEEGSAFRHGRGLQQGDPLSPLLFVIVMDVLSAMFKTAERAAVLADARSLGINHRVSLYADDVVVAGAKMTWEYVVDKDARKLA
jgi:mannosylglycoprotein endo-beta-mannosidase